MLSGLSGLSNLSGNTRFYSPELYGATHHWSARFLAGYSDNNLINLLVDRVGDVDFTSGNEPFYDENKINKFPSINFTVAQTRMSGSGVGISGSGAYTVFIVAKRVDSTGRSILSLGSTGGNTNTHRRLQSNYAIVFPNGNRVFNPPANPEDWKIWTFYASAGATYAQQNLAINGVPLTELSNSAGTTVPAIIDAASYLGFARNSNTNVAFFNGEVAEVVIFPFYNANVLNINGKFLSRIFDLPWTEFTG